jgi:ferritin-like metal-binding protein YciE
MALQTTHDLFEHELRDIYFAEKRLTKELLKLSKDAESLELSRAFASHQKETEGHVKRLEKVFKMIDKTPRGKKCEGVLGLLEEHKSAMDEKPSESVSELVHISGAIKVERYEISAYEGLIQLAQSLGMSGAVSLLEDNLREELFALEKLHQISGAGSTTFTGGEQGQPVGAA